MIRFCSAAVALVLVAGPAMPQPPARRLLVVPFENARRDPRLHWMSEASALLLADELNAFGVPAITRDERARAFDELHLPASAPLTRATVIRVGELVGASEVIVGEFRLEGTDLTVAARRIRIDVGRLEPEAREQRPLADLFGLFEALARRMLAAAGNNPARAPVPARPPLGAFELYVKGLVADSPAAQATLLETALREYREYDRASLALWDVRTAQGDHAAALAAVRAVSAQSPLARRARFRAATSLMELQRHDEAFEAFSPLAEGPGAPAVFNNLGVLQLRRGPTAQTGTAAYYLTKAADAHPANQDYLFNLGYAYALEKNSQGAIYWLREALRRDPADADAHVVIAAALQMAGSTVEAARERELARQLSSVYEDRDARPVPDPAIPKGLERLRFDLDDVPGPRPDEVMIGSAQRETRELAAFHLERGRRLFEREDDREAMTELRRAVYLSPYEAEAHLLIGRIHLRGRRWDAAVDALTISVWSADGAPARIALAEAYLELQKPGQAKTELQRALALDPASAEAARLLATMK